MGQAIPIVAFHFYLSEHGGPQVLGSYIPSPPNISDDAIASPHISSSRYLVHEYYVRVYFTFSFLCKYMYKCLPIPIRDEVRATGETYSN